MCRTKCLLFSILLSLSACTSYYSKLTRAEMNPGCGDHIRPSPPSTAWFDASIEVSGHHFSGLMLIKLMPDSSHRIVFTTETGFTLFDFALSRKGDFEKKYILSRLDRRPVVNTLRDDLILALGLPFDGRETIWFRENEWYFQRRHGRTLYYYIADHECTRLRRLESGTRRKRMVSVEFSGEAWPTPSEVVIRHHTFPMVMILKKMTIAHG